MPPKKKPETSKKTEQKKQAKVIEDKTFGLKNKKGTKQQKFVTQVEKQVKCGQLPARKLDVQDPNAKKKEEKKKQQDELNALFRPVTKQQKVEKGADPKSVVCAFYKQGLCQKGERCKFSHDLMLERKGEKRSAYVDVREDDTMDDWDEAKLEEVVNKKHGEKEKTKPKTDIICKFFVQALEECKYGWFWECPNGENCHYRHALPPGFVLKKDKKKMADQEDDGISLEELVETERSKLATSATLTKITLESFLSWKKRKRLEKIDKDDKDKEKKRAEFQAGRMVGLSGRDMFTFKPEMAGEDDDEAEDGVTYTREPEEDDDYGGVVVVEIDMEALSRQARDVDDPSGGACTISTAASRVAAATTTTTAADDIANHNATTPPADEDESDKLEQACGGGDLPPSSQHVANNSGVEINEDLFTDEVEVDEELFGLEAAEDLDGVDTSLGDLHLTNHTGSAGTPATHHQ